MTAFVPAWLDSPPNKALVVPPIVTRAQALPFGELTWPNFERLILRLVRRQKTVIDCSLYGTIGQAQEGLDILATTVDGAQFYCYQCKKVRKFDDNDIRKVVTKFLAGTWANKTSIFVLCVAIPLENTQQQDEIVKQRKRLKRRAIKFIIWDGASGGTLSEQLKCLPELVDDFFGRHWVKQFNGEEAAVNLAERLDGNELGKLRQRLHGLYTTVFNQHDPGLGLPGVNTLSYVDRYVPIDVTEQTTLHVAPQAEATHSEVASQSSPTISLDTQQPAAGHSSSKLNIHESRRQLIEWLSGKQHCVVLGEPGYGKSALLRYLALSLLDIESSNIRLLDPSHMHRLPVWMSFARHAGIIKENPTASVNDYVRDWLHQHSFDDIYPLFERALKHSDVLWCGTSWDCT